MKKVLFFLITIVFVVVLWRAVSKRTPTQPVVTTDTTPVDTSATTGTSATPSATTLTASYAGKGFSISLPSLSHTPRTEDPAKYHIDESYEYAQSANKTIKGVKFIIPQQYVAGTNLGSDSGISVEQLPNATQCTATAFIENPSDITTVTDNGKTYSVAKVNDAGLGNRYEETVYAIAGSSPCTAVRYFVHYSVIENYPAGTVKEFDKQSLLDEFDQIRRSLVLAK